MSLGGGRRELYACTGYRESYLREFVRVWEGGLRSSRELYRAIESCTEWYRVVGSCKESGHLGRGPRES